MVKLRDWGQHVAWCDWIELGGSLGRGAGDAWSDIDAGVGILDDGTPITDRIDEILPVIRAFAPVADTLRQQLGAGDRSFPHLIIQYEDGRQLSLAVVPAGFRDGLPPQTMAILDKSGRLATPVCADRYEPTRETVREWAFVAWVSIGDAQRHARRGHVWRALRSLTEARDLVWCLHAVALGVPYPGFGAVSVENAGLPPPQDLELTHPGQVTPDALVSGARHLASILTPLAAPHDVAGIGSVVQDRLNAGLPEPPRLQ